MRNILILLIVLMFGACASPPSPIEGTPETAATLTLVAPAPPAPSGIVTPTKEPPLRLVGVLLGTDGREDKPGYGIRTDIFVIVVVEVPKQGPINLTLLAIPRDLFVIVPCEPAGDGETPMNRVNSAWYRGGFDCVRELVETNFGLKVDAPVGLIDMPDVVRVFDAMGGIVLVPEKTHADKCLEQPVVWVSGETYRMSGAEVLCFVRGRNGYGGDIDRGRRAVEIMRAVAVQWPASILYNPARALELLDAFLLAGWVETDADLANITRLAWAMLPRLPDGFEVRSAHLFVEDLDFASHERYGSILIPLVDLKAWAAEQVR